MDILFPSYVCPIYLGRFRIVIGLRFLLQSYPHSQASYRISVRQTRCLPPASSRFRLAADTLAFGCNLPTIRAVIVCKGRIIGRGHNMTEMLHDPTAHAEMIAITSATEAVGGKYLGDSTLT